MIETSGHRAPPRVRYREACATMESETGAGGRTPQSKRLPQGLPRRR
jgi:hypothetical protein